MRNILCQCYAGASWKDRVRKMPEEQVVAVYKRMERHGELHPHNRRVPEQSVIEQPKFNEPYYDEQGRIWVTRDRNYLIYSSP